MGLLDGELAEIIGTALPDAGLSLPAVLIKVTAVQRDPTRVTAKTTPVTTEHAAQGFVARLDVFMRTNTLIRDATRVVKLYSSTIAGGAIPVPGDRITIDGVTSVVVNDEFGRKSVTTDAAKSMYTCQCR